MPVEVWLLVLGATIASSFGPAFATFAPWVTIPSVVASFAIGLVAGDARPTVRRGFRPIEAFRYQ